MIFRITKHKFAALKPDIANGTRVVGRGEWRSLYRSPSDPGPRNQVVAQFDSMAANTAYIGRVTDLEQMFDDCQARFNRVQGCDFMEQMVWVPYVQLYNQFIKDYHSSMVPKVIRIKATTTRSQITHPMALYYAQF